MATLIIAGGVWALWVIFLLAVMALAKPNAPTFTGFRVVIPVSLATILNPDELAAVREHEHGHRHHLHVWTNLALNLIFVRPSTTRRQRQEIEADDYAAVRCGPRALASALRKLVLATALCDIIHYAELSPSTTFDLDRIARLEHSLS